MDEGDQPLPDGADGVGRCGRYASRQKATRRSTSMDAGLRKRAAGRRMPSSSIPGCQCRRRRHHHPQDRGDGSHAQARAQGPRRRPAAHATARQGHVRQAGRSAPTAVPIVRGGGTIALGILNPLLAIIPLLAKRQGKDSNCGQLIAEATKSASGRPRPVPVRRRTRSNLPKDEAKAKEKAPENRPEGPRPVAPLLSRLPRSSSRRLPQAV